MLIYVKKCHTSYEAFMTLNLKNLTLYTTLALLAFPAFSMTDKELGEGMRQDISKYMSTIKKEKILFHWVDASDINPRGQHNTAHDPSAAHYKTYVEKQGRRIYNRRRSGDSDIEGPGLYMASDALVSRAYGGQRSYGLIVGVLKVGAKVLTGSGLTLTIANDLSNEIKSRGCNAYNYETILDTFNNECLKIKQLLVAKDASFANGRIYSWSNRHVEGCSDREVSRDVSFPANVSSYYESETFVVYNTELFSDIFGFTHKTVKPNDKLASDILSYLKGVEQTTGQELLPDLQMENDAIKAMSKSDIDKFSQKYILGCVK